MRRLTILFYISLLVLPLSGQAADRVELSRDIDYFRNTRPDTPLPDVYLGAVYPPLPSGTVPLPVLAPPSLPALPLPEVPFSAEELPLSAPVLLPVPGLVFPRENRERTSLFLSAAKEAGAELEAHHAFPSLGAALFLAGGRSWQGEPLPWVSAGITSEGSSSFDVLGGYRPGEKELLYGLAGWEGGLAGPRFRFPQKASLFLEESLSDDASFWPGIRTGIVFSGSAWSPAFLLEAEGLFQGERSNYRLRPALGISRRGTTAGGRVWRAEGEVLFEYETDPAEAALFADGFLSLVTPGDFGVFLTAGRDDVDRKTRMALGLREETTSGLMQFTGWQDGGVGVSGSARRWDYHLQAGLRWGDFLREDGQLYRVRRETTPYGLGEFRYEKSSLPVTDISFHAEYLNRRDLQFRIKNTWYFSDNPWSVGVRAGHYHPRDEKLSSLVRKEDWLYGLFANYSGKRPGRIGLFLQYSPDRELPDGGVSLRLSY